MASLGPLQQSPYHSFEDLKELEGSTSAKHVELSEQEEGDILISVPPKHEPGASSSLLDHDYREQQRTDSPRPGTLAQQRGRKQLTRQRVFPDDTTRSSTAYIVGGIVVSILLADTHHIFLSWLHARPIDEFSQFWVKNASNGLASAVAIAIGVSATSALVQAKWRAAGKQSMPIRTIDNLFALPAPSALAQTLARPKRVLGLPIIATILIQALVLVGVLAPNALTVEPSERVTRVVRVPSLDLSKGSLSSIEYATVGIYTNVSMTWSSLLNSIMLVPPVTNWKAPLGCGVACIFELEYNAPGLECRNLTSDEIRPQSSNLTWDSHVYEASSSLYPNWNRSQIDVHWDIDDVYDLIISHNTYRPAEPESFLQGGQGVSCTFRNATYHATVDFSNNTQRATTSIVSYGAVLGGQQNCLYDPWNAVGPFPECWVNGINTRALCEIFAAAFVGRIRIPGLFTIDVGNLQLVRSIFNLTQSGEGDPSFDLKVPDLGESLVGIFSNLTLGFIPHRDQTTLVEMIAWDGKNVWNYTKWILWAVYIPFFALAIPVALYGLFSIRVCGMGMDDKFSSYLITTRGANPDAKCQSSLTFDDLQTARLVYQKNKASFVDSARI
ncbi:hypothetical protein M408DRAFT_10190 [Serendipita vermifera MAFF 305830]|uniref:Uncharacterized protein n=1 Tax=Serendipita vermifera MAFF 305830 TaxID=933852 RepID=A0A0C3AMZ4_SERVB|nr:hypothetical protein M408DRAFT_10190 [Serendipita vermifera MAFF 305830]